MKFIFSRNQIKQLRGKSLDEQGELQRKAIAYSSKCENGSWLHVCSYLAQFILIPFLIGSNEIHIFIRLPLIFLCLFGLPYIVAGFCYWPEVQKALDELENFPHRAKRKKKKSITPWILAISYTISSIIGAPIMIKAGFNDMAWVNQLNTKGKKSMGHVLSIEKPSYQSHLSEWRVSHYLVTITYPTETLSTVEKKFLVSRFNLPTEDIVPITYLPDDPMTSSIGNPVPQDYIKMTIGIILLFGLIVPIWIYFHYRKPG